MAKLYAKAPDGSDALLSIVITGFTQSLQQNGWCKLPNGLLFQWSKSSTGEPGYWTLPISMSLYSGVTAISGNYGGATTNACWQSSKQRIEYNNIIIGTFIIVIGI